MKNIIRRAARRGCFFSLVILCSWNSALHATPIYQLAGHGTTGLGGWDLTLDANLNLSAATGFASIRGGATGPIVQIVPPNNDPNSFWCINVRRTDTMPADGDQRWNIYIRDIGDGITTFDQFSFVAGIGIDCSFQTKDLFFLPVAQGDFTATASAVGVPEANPTIVIFLIALVGIEGCRRLLARRNTV
jgi:hypothetical protein